MKKLLALVLATMMLLAVAASAVAEGATTFLWDNFDDRDPNSKPELAPNGVQIWWDNWANLRAKNEDGAIKLDYRPKAFDPEDYDSEEDYFAHAADWMANWGEAVNMWAPVCIIKTKPAMPDRMPQRRCAMKRVCRTFTPSISALCRFPPTA